MSFKRFLLSVVFQLLVFSASAQAPGAARVASERDTLQTISIREARVSGDRRAGTDLLAAQTLEGAALRRLSALSVADAVRFFSGVQLKDYGGVGGLKTVNIRSMGTHHVGVFYDGIALGNAQNGQIDLGRFSLENMEAVSVYNGQRARIFQPAADFGSSGTVYLQSRVPVFADSARRNLRFTMKGGSFGLANPSFLWEEKLSPRVSAALSGELTSTTGRYRFRYRTTGGYDTTATRRNGDLTAVRAEAGVFGRTDDAVWRAKAYFYRSERGLPGAIVRNRLSHEDRQWDTNVFLQGSWQRKLSRRYELLINAKYAYDFLRYLSDPRRDVSQMYVDNRYRQQEAYVSAANLVNFSRHFSFSFSADYRWNTLSADLYDFAYPTRQTLLTSAAAALDYERFRAQASLLGSFFFESVRRNTASAGDKQRLTPALFLTFRPFRRADLGFHAFYKEIFRMPTLNDLYYTFIGNVDLRPESTEQYDFGVSWRKRRQRGAFRTAELRIDAYYNRVRDKIVAIPTSNQFRWTMMNLGKVRIIGADATVSASFQLPLAIVLDAKAAYTYQNATDRTNSADVFYGDRIPYVPLHSASLVLGFTWEAWAMNYSFIYTGDRYDQKANIPENYAPAWYTSDLALFRSFRWRRADLRLGAEVCNLFNQQFEVVKGYPMPGTNYKLTLNVQL